jgi:hypothetical protein
MAFKTWNVHGLKYRSVAAGNFLKSQVFAAADNRRQRLRTEHMIKRGRRERFQCPISGGDF